MMPEKYRHHIRSYVHKPPRNTAEIVEHARANMDGTSIEQIEKLLKSDAQVVRVDLVRRSGVLSSGYKICEWATVDWMKNRRREE